MPDTRSFLALAMCLIVWFLPAGAESAQIDRIVAIVNDDVITETEFENQLQRVRQEFQARKAQLPPISILKRQVLERMVAEKIQLQIAKRLGIEVSDDAVDKAVSEVAKRNKLTVGGLRDTLAQDGVSFAEFREDIKTQLIIRRLIELEVVSRVAVTEEEVESFLANQKSRKENPKEYDVSHILLLAPESENKQSIVKLREKAETVLKKIRDGMSFEQAAINYSQAQNALEGGALGWRQESQLPALFLEAVRGMEAGQVSDVLRSPNGFHILKLNDSRGGSRVAVEQTKVRHILIKSDEFLSPAEATQRIKRIRERIVAGEDFAELASKYSDDPMSSVNGGDLGWLNSGEAVPEFEAAVYRLQAGELSQPVRTPFGVHLIQVLDRRQQELDEDLGRTSALAQIRAQKSDERYEDWLRRLRDESYVEFRSDDL